VPALPEGLEVARHRDLQGRGGEPWARRAALLAMVVALALALLNVFGQATSATTAGAPAATISLDAPTTVRGGLLFQSLVEVRARTSIDHPRLVFNHGWLDGMQVSSIEPSAVGESSRDGRLVLSYDKLAAGDRLTVWLQFQADPTYSGSRDQGLELDDATVPLARIRRTLHVLP